MMQNQAEEEELGLSVKALIALKEFALENNLLPGVFRSFSCGAPMKYQYYYTRRGDTGVCYSSEAHRKRVLQYCATA